MFVNCDRCWDGEKRHGEHSGKEWGIEGQGKQDLRALGLQVWLREGMTKNSSLGSKEEGRESAVSFVFWCLLVVFYLSVSHLTVKWFPSHSGVPDANVWSGIDAKPHLLQTLGDAVTLCRPANVQIPLRSGWGKMGGLGGRWRKLRWRNAHPPERAASLRNTVSIT